MVGLQELIEKQPFSAETKSHIQQFARLPSQPQNLATTVLKHCTTGIRQTSFFHDIASDLYDLAAKFDNAETQKCAAQLARTLLELSKEMHWANKWYFHEIKAAQLTKDKAMRAFAHDFSSDAARTIYKETGSVTWMLRAYRQSIKAALMFAEMDRPQAGYSFSFAADAARLLARYRDAKVWTPLEYEASVVAAHFLKPINPKHAMHTELFAASSAKKMADLTDIFSKRCVWLERAYTHQTANSEALKEINRRQAGYGYGFAANYANKIAKSLRSEEWEIKSYQANISSADLLEDNDPAQSGKARHYAAEKATALFYKTKNTEWLDKALIAYIKADKSLKDEEILEKNRKAFRTLKSKMQ